MGWDSFFAKQWNRNKKWDPGTHKLLEAVVKQDSHNVGIMARHDAKMFGGENTWLGRRANDLGDEANKNERDPVRGVGRGALGAGAVFGAMYGAGALGGGAGAGEAGAGAAGGAAGGEVAGSGLVASTGEGTALVGSTGAGAGSGAGIVAGGGGAQGAGMVSSGAAGAGGGINGPVLEGAAAGSGSAIGEGGSSGGFNWQRWGRMASNMGQQGQRHQEMPLRESDVDVDSPDLARYYAVSSKDLKMPARARMESPMADGASGKDPISENGVQIAAIQAMTKKVEALHKRLSQLKERA